VAALGEVDVGGGFIYRGMFLSEVPGGFDCFLNYFYRAGVTIPKNMSSL
jgi:hypothetical protein